MRNSRLLLLLFLSIFMAACNNTKNTEVAEAEELVGDGVEPLEAQVIPSGRRRLQRETEFLVGAPSAHLFPSWARRVVGSYLRSHMGVRDPRVALVMDFAMRPTRSLAFNVYRDDQEDAAAFDLAMQRLASWYLPPGLGILSLGRDSDGSLQTKL